MLDLFIAILKNANTKNTWSQWVATSRDPSAASTRETLQTCFSGIPPCRRHGVVKKLRSADSAEVDATLHHLVSHELLRRLDLEPDWEPDIGNLTPDLAFRSHGARFIGDVFVSVNAHLILYFSGHPPVRLVNIIRTAGASFIIRA